MRFRKEQPLEVGDDPTQKRDVRLTIFVTQTEAVSLRDAAAGQKGGLSQYVMDRHYKRPVNTVDLGSVHELARLREAMTQLPQSVRDLEADLGRLSGRLASFFSSENSRLAYDNQSAINGTIFAVRDLCERVLPVLAQLQQDMIEPRWEALKILRAISQNNRLG